MAVCNSSSNTIMNIKVGDLVKKDKGDGNWDLYIVKSFYGDKAVCISHVNEEKEAIFLISELIRLNDPADT